MNRVVKETNLQPQTSKEIVPNDDFLTDLSTLMENVQFKDFYDKHMANWTDIRCTTSVSGIINWKTWVSMNLLKNYKDSREGSSFSNAPVV